MPTGYNRTDTTNNIATGNIINASDLDAEYDAIDAAFDETTGHDHGGASGNGAPITKVGPVQDLVVSASTVTPKTTNTLDLGTPLLKFKDLNLAGNALIAGTLGVTGVTTFTAQPILSSLTASRAVFSDASKGLVSNTLTGTGNVVMSDSPTLTGTIGAASQTLSGSLTVGTTLGVTGNTTLTGTLIGDNVTDSTSTTTGAIQTDGGLGVAKALWVGGLANIAGAVTLQSTLNVTGVTTLGAGAILNTPTSVTLTNATGLPISSGVAGLGTGVATALAVNIGSAGAPVLFNGALGTPSSGTVTNLTGTASININGTVGATTANTGAFTNLSYTGTLTGGTGVVNLGSGQFYKDASGNVGIGATPTAVYAGTKNFQIGTTQYIFANNLSGGGGFVGNAYLDASATWKYATSAAATFYNNQAGLHIWSYAASGTAGATVTFTEAMRIDSSGNVGIGTSSPAGAAGRNLTIYNSSGQSRLALKNSVTGDAAGDGFQVGIDGDGEALLDQRENLTMRFSTNATERMRIDSSGNVGIGAVPNSSWGGGKALVFNGGYIQGFSASELDSGANVYFNGSSHIYLANNFASIYRQTDGTHRWYNAPSGTAGNAATFSERMRIDSSGNLLVGTTATVGPSANCFYNGVAQYALVVARNSGASQGNMAFVNGTSTVGAVNTTTTSTSYATSSDYRLKENIAPMTGALDVVQQLKPVTYNWKADGSSGQGFIAHELQAVVPECVTGEKDAVDKDGKPVYQGIDTSFLVATLTKAIQEQQALIENLTTRLNALEGL